MKPLIVTLLLFSSLLCANSYEAQLEKELWSEIYKPAYTTPTQIKKGETLRAILFDKLRQPIAKEAKSKVKFSGKITVYRNWALFVGSSYDPKGKLISYKPMNESDVVALWLRTVNGWVVVDYAVGVTDTFYTIWYRQYGMPKELLK
jgi:hypothetical protein